MIFESKANEIILDSGIKKYYYNGIVWVLEARFSRQVMFFVEHRGKKVSVYGKKTINFKASLRGYSRNLPKELFLQRERKKDMLAGKAVIRNWRDQIPVVGHNSAIVWSLLRPVESDNPLELAQLRRMTGIVKHALQGRQTSDYHSHEDMEQVYYILKGNGIMHIDGEKYPVQEGDIVYLPPKCMHQLLNEGEDWMEHLIISCKLSS